MNAIQADCTGSAADYEVGELRVWRGWSVDSLGRLRGLQFSQVWRPDGIHAEHRRSLSAWFDLLAVPPSFAGEPTHEAPARECTCGIYCYYDHRGPLDRFGVNRRTHNVVFGVAEVWGRVLVGTRGLRAQHARPVGLVAPPAALPLGPLARRNVVHRDRYERLRENYPDITWRRSRRALVRALPLWIPSLSPGSSDPDFWDRDAS